MGRIIRHTMHVVNTNIKFLARVIVRYRKNQIKHHNYRIEHIVNVLQCFLKIFLRF